MRNLRKLTAVVIAIALVLTSMATVFAAATPANADKAATLKDLGLYAGKDATNPAVGLEDALEVQQSLVYLANMFGYKADADKMTDDEASKALAKFADADKIAGYAKNVVAYSAANGIIAGTKTNDGKLYVKPTATVTAARFATFIINGLGYELEGSYTEAVAQLAEINGNKIDAAAAGDLTRDAAIGMMYGALTAKTAAGKTVVENLVAANASLKAVAEKAGLLVDNSGALDVASVTATNLRELVVTFNKAVTDTDAAKKTANYKIGSNNPEAVTLSDDNKTVTIRTSSANAMGNYGTVDLTIDKAVGFAANKEIKGIAIKDTTVPSAVSAKTTGPKNIKVTLSEPLKTHSPALTGSDIANSLKIDNGLIAIDSGNTTTSGLEINIKTYSDLTEGSHKIEFLADKSLLDNAGYKLQAATITFDYAKDTSPLTLSVVESNETSVTIKFNKAIDATTLIGNADVKFRHTYNTDFNQVTGTSSGASGSIANSGDDQKFTVTFPTGKPLPPSTVTVYIDGYDKVKDNYGNKLTTSSFTVSTAADLVKPTATVEFVDAKTVKVTYSEDVKNDGGANAANNTNNYVLKCGNDVKTITGFAYDPADSKKVIKLFTAEDALNGTTYTLTIKNVKDTSVAGNQIDEVTLTFTGTDKVAPAIDSITLVANDKVKVKFTEAMDVPTITSKSIYKLDGNALKDDDKVEAVDENKAALITFKTAPAAGTHKLLVGWVKDVAGNWSKLYQDEKTFTGLDVAKIGLKEYQITGKNNIKLKFEGTLKDMVVSDFAYSVDGGTNYTSPKSLSVSVADGNTYITLVTNDLPNTTGGGIAVKSVNNADGVTFAKNDFGTTLKFDVTTGIVDKCAPEKSSISFSTKGDAKGDKETLDKIFITYSEDIYAASVQESDYTVAGYEVDKVEVAGKVVTITVKNLDYGSYSIGSEVEVKVKQAGEIQDSAKNALGAQDEWTSAKQRIVAAP